MAFGLSASGDLQKGSSSTEICEHKTLPSDPGTVGETLEAVGFSATLEKMDR